MADPKEIAWSAPPMLYDEKKTDALTFFKETVRCISTSLDMDQVLTCLLEAMKGHIPMHRLILVSYDYQKNKIKRLGRAALTDVPVLPEYVDVENGPAYVERAFGNPDPVIVINHSQREPLARIYEDLYGVQNESHMAILLEHDGERIGALVASWKERHVYTQVHKDLFLLVREPMTLALSNTLRYQELLRLKERYLNERNELAKRFHADDPEGVIGADTGLVSVMERIRKVAPRESSVLILGETGVGKEVLAKEIHRLSSRKAGPFIKIDCGTIPESLVESELFGHEKGAFTGADTQKQGSLELADGGTVFLDEIGELSLNSQVKLLRLIQHREMRRVGGNQVIHLNIRIICATHRHLQEMVAKGTFREDLLFRLNVFPIQIPPLRERKEDIPGLVRHLIRKKCREIGLGILPDPDNFQLGELAAYDWPGNVRELENVIERWLILSGGSGSFRPLLRPFVPDSPADEPVTAGFAKMVAPDQILPLDTVMRAYLQSALEACGYQVGGKEGVAVRLGLPRTTLRSRMEKLGMAKRRSFSSSLPAHG